jgi:molecular chaperone HtpG
MDVRLSKVLKSGAVCMTADGPLSLEMEKYFQKMGDEGMGMMKAQRVLELNPEHPVFAKLRELDEERLSLYAKVLYGQALLVEGTPLEDPAEFARQVSAIIA